MIKLDKINKYYTSGEQRIHALKDLSITFPDKGLVFILGQSGCGKSTLLNLLGGLDKPDDGVIYIEDKDMNTFSKKDLNNYLNSYLGFVFQEYNILKDLNLYQNISLPLEMQSVSRKLRHERVNDILEQVELKGLEKRKVNELSGGQRQRIAIARALIKDPKLIIADEPTGNLDSVTSDTIFNLFKTLSKDRLIIIVTHDEESAYKFGDRIITIDDGNLINDSNPNLKSETPINLKLNNATVPLATSVKLSCKNIMKKRFRFLIMTLICALSLAFLSFTIELNSDLLRENIYTTIENGYTYTDLFAKTIYPDDYVKTSFYDDYQGHNLPAGAFDVLKNDYNELDLHQYHAYYYQLTEPSDERINFFYTGTIKYVVTYLPSNNYDLMAGRTPTSGKKEIMITDYLIAMFEHFKLYPNCKTPYDYLNRMITLATGTSYRIVGVLKTNYLTWSSFSKDKSVDETYKLNYPYTNQYKMMNALYLEESDYINEIASTPSNIDTTNVNSIINLTYVDTGNIVELNNYNFTTNSLPLQSYNHPRQGNLIAGRSPENESEIVVSYMLAGDLIGKGDLNPNVSSGENSFSRIIRNQIIDRAVTLNISDENGNLTTLNLKIVGLTTSTYYNSIQLDKNSQTILNNSLNASTTNLLIKLPRVKENAYNLFNKMYEAGYIIDVWAYRADIDSYTIDPFIDLLSKVGLFVFAIFSIGILWTIITLEIVDSKKEIGIFRSIGLSGLKVSFIFIFQTLVISIIAYGLALLIGNYAINLFSSKIMDDLHLVSLSMFMMTYRSPIYLFGFLILIVSAAIFFPLYKIMSQKIIDVISERDVL